MKTILCICHDVPPLTFPTAIKTEGLFAYLCKDWKIRVVTSVKGGFVNESIPVHFAKSWAPLFLFRALKRLKLNKLINLFIWPDEAIFWILPAIFKAKALIKQYKPSAIIVFMMPYSAGLVGIILKFLTGLPLILSFDDSYSCTDMHSTFPSYLHYKMSIRLEDFYIKNSDSLIYVSKRNLEAGASRHFENVQSKLYLVRFGADRKHFLRANINTKTSAEFFRIIYIGGMTGWLAFYKPANHVLLRKLFERWEELGVYELVKRQSCSHSPIFIGRAIKQVLTQEPGWRGKIIMDVYGAIHPPQRVVERILENEGLRDVVNVYDGVTHAEAINLICQADLLFLALRNGPDNYPSGIISSKTFEYLMTDKPILAALPKGENREFLEDKQGVWLVEPKETSSMAGVIKELAAAKFSGKPLAFDRSNIYDQLSYEQRAKEFTQIINSVI